MSLEIHDLGGNHDFSKIISIFFEPEANLIFWPTLYTCMCFFLRRYASFFLFITMSIATSNAFTAVLKGVIGRARPYIFIKDGFFGFHPFALKSAFSSFPSGHATTIFAIMTCLGFSLPRFRYGFFVLGFLLSLSRVFLLDHFISDLLGSALISLLITAFLYKKSLYKIKATSDY